MWGAVPLFVDGPKDTSQIRLNSELRLREKRITISLGFFDCPECQRLSRMCEILRENHAALCALHLAATLDVTIAHVHSLETILVDAAAQMRRGKMSLEEHQETHVTRSRTARQSRVR